MSAGWQKLWTAQQMSNKTTLLSFFGSHTLNVPFCSLFHAIFLLFIYFFAFCRWFHCLKWPPSLGLKCYPVFLSVMCLTEKMCVLDVSLRVSYSAIAVSSMLMNQQYTVNEVSLNKNTHNNRLCFGQLMKMLWLEACRNLTLHFPQEQPFIICQFSIHRGFIDSNNE